jgi:hypothetical protein
VVHPQSALVAVVRQYADRRAMVSQDAVFAAGITRDIDHA